MKTTETACVSGELCYFKEEGEGEEKEKKKKIRFSYRACM